MPQELRHQTTNLSEESTRRLVTYGCGLVMTFLPATLPVLSPSACAQDSRYKEMRIAKATNLVFPTPQAELTEMRNHADKHGIRSHAWAIFASLIPPSDPNVPQSAAIWETWYTRSETLTSTGACTQKYQDNKIHRELEMPLEVVAAFQAQMQRAQDNDLGKIASYFTAPGKSTSSNVLYNHSACKHIQDFTLYDQKSLEKRLTGLSDVKAPGREREIVQFPPTAIVVKASWAVVTRGGSYLSVWDQPDSGRSDCHDGCSRQIFVMPAREGVPCNLPAAANGNVLSSCFYSVPVTTENAAELRRSRSVDPGDVFVLVGLHVITKEMPDWVWSTFWWHDKANAGEYGEDRPDLSVIPRPWNNYLMNATLSMETPWEPEARTGVNIENPRCPLPNSPTAKICFNPFLEGAILNGVRSNCMNCHKQAVYDNPSSPSVAETDPRGAAQRGHVSSDAACFARSMRVDYLWTLSPTMSSSLQTFIQNLTTAMNAR